MNPHPKRPNLTPEAAKPIPTITFEPEDLKRMHELAMKNQDGVRSEGEQHELESHRRVGQLLDMLHSKARLTLKIAGQKT
jgi:hypothetical protein